MGLWDSSVARELGISGIAHWLERLGRWGSSVTRAVWDSG